MKSYNNEYTHTSEIKRTYYPEGHSHLLQDDVDVYDKCPSPLTPSNPDDTIINNKTLSIDNFVYIDFYDIEQVCDSISKKVEVIKATLRFKSVNSAKEFIELNYNKRIFNCPFFRTYTLETIINKKPLSLK